MGKWNHTVSVKNVWKTEDLEKIAKVAAFHLRRLMPKFDGDIELEEICEELEHIASNGCDVEEFDEVWDSLYDWADYNRVWIETF